MTLVVGLGNPTSAYKNNRHNIGFMVVDSYVSSLNPTKVNRSSFNAELYKVSNTLFLKPLTYMNNSGLSVISVANYYKIDDVIVIHDDLEIPFGSIRLKKGGGNGGHNGLRSIDEHFGKDYTRIRIGISKPQDKEDISNYVLSDFTKKEMECLPDIIKHSCEALGCLLESDLAHCSAKYTVRKSICNEA